MANLSKHSEQPWFDIRVLYVRLNACLCSEAPNSLRLAYPPRQIHTELEVNGARIPPSEKACFTLRKDREDADSSEATYVSTNNIRVSSDLPFEIHSRDGLLIYGTIRIDEHQSCEGETSSNEATWSMDCRCGITSSSCPFLKRRVNFSAVNPGLEVYMAGRSHGLPIVLSQTVQFILRKKTLRQCSLDVIQEGEELVSDRIVAAGQVAKQEEACARFMDESMAWGMAQSLYWSDGVGVPTFDEGGDGEFSLFNAGVRVGVGIGLGICLGAGIGVGLLMRTSHATTKAFRRRLFL